MVMQLFPNHKKTSISLDLINNSFCSPMEGSSQPVEQETSILEATVVAPKRKERLKDKSLKTTLKPFFPPLVSREY